jgi:hypothetical protein
VIVGERGNASATAQPTEIVDVEQIAAAAETKALWVVSATQQDSKPAASAARARRPSSVIGPAIPIP